MSHDPLCGLSQPCDDEIREHGYCLMSHGKFCIHCNQWCICGEVRMAEQRMLAKCITVADAVLAGVPTSFWINRNSDEAQEHKRSMRAAVEDALRALQEKP